MIKNSVYQQMIESKNHVYSHNKRERVLTVFWVCMGNENLSSSAILQHTH